MNPRVKQVSVLNDYKLSIVFSNGEQGIYDCSGLVEFGVFKEFKNYSYFRLAKVSAGTVVWPHEQDICPDTLYLDSTREMDQMVKGPSSIMKPKNA
jgi:hypothetical protein